MNDELNPSEVPLLEVLEGLFKYMEQTRAKAISSRDGYPIDLERCLQYQIEAIKENS